MKCRLYTDGACSGNPGPGAWACVLVRGGKVVNSEWGALPHTTNNVAELTALLCGLKALIEDEREVVVVTDSQNMIGWISLGWKRKDPKISALAAEIDKVIAEKSLMISFEHVKGHSGDRFNEMANQKRIAMEVSAMHIFQTADSTIVDNILTDIQSGDVLKVRTPGAITPIANEERNMQAFRAEEETYNSLADRVSFVNDVLSGQQLPSSTPATNAALANTNSKSVFKLKRQNFTIFLREFFNLFVIPQVIKEITPEHVIRFTGDVQDLQKIDDAHTNIIINNAIIEHVSNGGDVPTEDEIAQIKQEAMSEMKKLGGERFVSFVKDFYGDAEFEFDILIDEEQEPIATLAQNTFQLLTSVAQNPQLLENPVTKALIYDWAQKVGINPVKLEIAEAKGNQNPQQLQQISQLTNNVTPQNGQLQTRPQ